MWYTCIPERQGFSPPSREDGIARTEQDVCDNAQCDYCGAMNGVSGRCSSYDKTVGVSEGAV